jgi:hypothetical protein
LHKNGGAVIEGPRIVKWAGRTFIVGTLLDIWEPDGPRSRKTIWVPSDQVDQIVEFADVEAVKKYYPPPPPLAPAPPPADSSYRQAVPVPGSAPSESPPPAALPDRYYPPTGGK